MITRAVRTLMLACLWLAPASADAGWLEIFQADASFDLQSARALALETVASEAAGADGVAAAGWWLANLDSIWEPAAILGVVDADADPELRFTLARIAAELARRPPEGSLPLAELAGPFGGYSVLDLDRWVVPADSHLPPLGTPWQGPQDPFRLRLRFASARVAPSALMRSPGIYLAAWTFSLAAPLDGWLVVEAQEGCNLEVDGASVARLRRSGRDDPAVSWYTVNARAGDHRIRVELGGRGTPDVRISLLDEHGNPAPLQNSRRALGPWAPSQVEPAEPPAAARLFHRLQSPETAWQELLLAATIARGRGDPLRAHALLQRAFQRAPEEPWLHLVAARLLLSDPVGLDRDIAVREARQHLRHCGAIPLSTLVQWTVAGRQDRREDEERLLTTLVEEHGGDARVLRLWLAESVRRGWIPEAEEALAQLVDALPESRAVNELRLAVLEKLERWQERNHLLVELAAGDSINPRRVEQLAGSCFAEEAVAALRRLAGEVDDPVLDLGIARLLLELGRLDEAQVELTAARRRWGALPALSQLQLIAAAAGGGNLDHALGEALRSDPADLDLRSLAWRRGSEPFFAPYRVAALELAEARQPPPDDVDAEVVLDQAVERLFEDGSSLYYYHGLTRAITPEGARQASTLQQMPDALLLQVRIIKADGRVVVPPELAAAHGGLVLSDVKEGDMVEEEYVAGLAPSHPALRGHISPYVYRFADPDRAFGRSEYVILHPPGVPLEIEGNLRGLEHETWQEDGLHGQRFLARGVAPVAAEPLAPPAQELLPWVTLGVNVSWQDVGDSLRDRILPLLRSSPELDAWASEIMNEEGSPPQLLQQLTDALFAEVTPGSADLELGSTAGESFSRRRGNRVAIVASILASRGWQVELLLARPLAFARRHLQVPSLEAFSLPLLRVQHGEHTLWLDLAEERSGINHISPIVQGSDALRMPLWPGAAAGLEDELPVFANPDLEERVTLRAELQRDGSAQLSYQRAATGSQAENLLERLQSLPAEEEPLVYSQLAAGLFPGADRVAGRVKRDGSTVVLSLDLHLPASCSVDRGDMKCRKLLPTRPLVPALAALPTRTFPLLLPLPVTQSFTLEIVPPRGYSHDWQARYLDTPWGRVEETLEEGAGSIISTLRLELPAQTVEPADYPAFARFCHAVDELMSRPLVFREDPL